MSNNQDKKKYVYFITGGGTGGHIYPAVAVADALMQDEETKDLFYIGNPKNLEYDIVKQKGYKFLGINVHGMPRRFSFDFVKWAFQLWVAWLKCCFYLLKYKPNVVFGTGGYVSAPILLACISFIKGKTRPTPYMMHDCDAQPGLVTRKFSNHAKCVSLAFESAQEFVKNKNCCINGNPIREKFKTLTKEEARKTLGLENKLTVCIMGGSQGARTINDSAVEILKTLSLECNVQVIFQTGKKNFERAIEQLITIYPQYQSDKNIIIKPYFEDMVTVLKASDIAVSRSGSLSISEIEASGIAPIFVPYPHAASDHQRKNAKCMLEKNAGLYVEDSELTPKCLLDMLKSLINNPQKLHSIQQNVLSLAKFNGVENIVSQLKSIAESKKILYNKSIVK